MPKRKKRAMPKQATATSEAIVVAPPIRAREIPEKDIELIKRTVAKDCTDDELKLFLWVARKHKLDPMTRQLHAVKRNGTVCLQIGIDGYRSMAARYKDYGGIDEPEYEYANAGDKIPTMARVRVWKKGFDRPTVGIAFWSEYAPTGNQAFMWQKMPRLMLAKCAEALALRKAYPDLADIYTDEEMHQADVDITPSGRQIVDQDGYAPSGRAITYDARVEEGRAAAQRVAQERLPQHERPPVLAQKASPEPHGSRKPKRGPTCHRST